MSRSNAIMAAHRDLPRNLFRHVLRISSSPCHLIRTGLYRHLHTSYYLQDVMTVKMPSLSPTMMEGNIVKWYKNEGDAVAAGDILCDIQTDKTIVGFEFEEDGILAKILKTAGSEVIPIRTVIALMVEEGDDWQNVTVPESEEAKPGDASPASASSSSSQSADGPSTPPGHPVPYGPAVRSTLDMYGLQPGNINATGPHGRLLKGDVLRYIQEQGLKPVSPKSVAPPVQKATPVPPAPVAIPPAPAPAPVTAPPLKQAAPTPIPSQVEGDQFVDIELTSMRKTIARRLTESKTTIPHAYAGIDCSVDNVLKLRKDFIGDGTKVSVNDFIVKAAAVALQRVPEVNAMWTPEGGQVVSNIDVCVAVATEAGLITPIVTDAVSRGVADISETVKELAGRAREGRLKPEEFMGGTFTISNLGMFGISDFSAVINPPQAAIMAVGASQLTLDSDGAPKTVMNVTLSYDARIFDEHVASRFLETFREVLEDPMLMLSQGVPIDLQKLFAK